MLFNDILRLIPTYLGWTSGKPYHKYMYTFMQTNIYWEQMTHKLGMANMDRIRKTNTDKRL